MKTLFLASVLLLSTASSVRASVYAQQLSSGNWKVTKYDDGSPKFQLTYVDTSKTKSVRRVRSVKDYSSRKKVLTKSGQLKMQELQKKDIEWKNKPLDIPGASIYDTYGSYYCGASGIACTPPGTHGRPLEPEMTAGVDYYYQFKYKDKVYYEKVPNPNFGNIKKTSIVYSDKAKKPGGIPFIGSTDIMDIREFKQYYFYLCGSLTGCR